MSSPPRTSRSPGADGTAYMPRGVYLLPVGDRREGRPLIVLVSRHGRLLDLLPMEPDESEAAALARAAALLTMLDPEAG